MSHRVAVYNVRVYKRRRPKDERRLGDFDEAGTDLASTVQSYFHPGPFANTNDEDTRSVVCEISADDGDEVRSMFAHGESGMVAEIVDANGQLRFRQEPEHTQLVRCASLFRLPPNQKMGWWAVHINNRRSAKNLIEGKMLELFRHMHDDLTLKITPFVRGDDLKTAVDAGLVDQVTLVKYEQPTDRAVAATDKWVKAGDAGTLELQISGKNRLKTALIKRFVDGDHSAFGDIVTFEGMTFDEAKVQVEIDGARHRTFNIEKPEAGHAFTHDLDGLTIVNDEPTPDSLYDALARVLDDLT